MKRLLILTLISSTMISVTYANTPEGIFKRPYNRGDWGRWRDLDKNCFKTRDQLLKERSVSEPEIKDCVVLSGSWKDYYYGETINTVSEIDVDHVVPLKHAHDHGAYRWTRDKKIKYYNDPENLVLTESTYNRKKGSLDITKWHPKDKENACKYFKKWFGIKKKYKLRVARKERRYYNKMKCR